VKFSRNKRKRQPAFLAVFVYATHATQAIAFEWKPGFRRDAIQPIPLPNRLGYARHALTHRKVKHVRRSHFDLKF